MNTDQVNGNSLNGASSKGYNATLSDGCSSITSIISASLITGAILVGGLFSVSDSEGAVQANLQGGIYSTTSTVGGGQFTTAVLMDGIHSNTIVDAFLGMAPGLTDGIQSPISYGGQIIANAMLQSSDYVGQSSTIDGNILGGTGLSDGIYKTGYVGGGIMGGVMLVSGGILSNDQLDSNPMLYGVYLSDGISSTDDLQGTWHYPAILTYGILATGILSPEDIDIEAILTGGVSQVGSFDTNTMKLDMVMDGGIWSSNTLLGLLMLSPYNNGGISVDAPLSANYIIDAKVTGSLASTDYIGGPGIAATQKLIGGANSTEGMGGNIIIHIFLTGGLTPFEEFMGNLIASAMLQGNFQSTEMLSGNMLIHSYLNDGVFSTTTFSSNLLAESYLHSGLNSTDIISANLDADAVMYDGILSTDNIGGDIVSIPLDPYLNTWALEIRSATPLLEIFTPLQDV